MPQTRDNDLWDRFGKWLVGVGFLAWAGVVWLGYDRVDIIAFQSIENTKDLETHLARPWHEEAGRMVSILEQQIAHMSSTNAQVNTELRRLRAEIDELSDEISRLRATPPAVERAQP